MRNNDAPSSYPVSGQSPFWQSILDAMPSHLAILDGTGTIIAVNRAWRDFARKNGADPAAVSEGINYLDVCDRASGESAEGAKQAAAGIRAVLRGKQKSFSLDYACHSPHEQRWFKCLVSRLMNGEQAHVMVLHESITKRKQAAANQAFYYNALNASLNEIYIFDANSLRFEFVSQGACRNLGYSLAQMRQMTPLDIKPKHTRETFEALIAPLREKRLNELQFTTVHRRADGSQYPVEVHLQRFEQDDRQVFLAVILDISEREQAGKALRESEERYRLLFENNPLPMWIYDIKTLRFMSVNNTALAVYGYSKDEFLNMTLLDIRPADERKKLLRSIQKDLEQLQNSGPWLHRKKNGEIFAVEIFSHAIEYAGRAARLVIAHDISARHQAESQLLLLKTALETTANAVVITNRKSIIEWVNPAFSRLTGYTPQESLGKNPRDLVKSGLQDASFYKQLWDTLLAGQIWHGELINRRKDGSLYTEEMTITPILDDKGGISHFIAIKQDITERKRIQKDMEKHAVRLAIINDVGQKISGVLELQGVLELTARLVHNTFGFYHVALFTFDETNSELVMRARAGQFSDLFPPNHRIKLGSGMVGYVAQTAQRLLANDVHSEPHYTNFYPDRLPTASEISLPLRIGERILGVMDVQSPEKNAFSDADVAVLEILADQVSVAIENSHLYETAQQELEERKRAERELQEYQAHLEEVIRERTSELVIARDRAEAASHAKSDFLAVMSHEIRTPLNGILGLTQLMQQTPLNNKQKDYMARLQHSGETLLATINDILDFSKIESNSMQLESVNFNLDDVLRKLSSLVAYRAQEKGLELVFNTSPDVPRLLVGDPLRLGQVLLNLVGNAIKFTELGEVVVKISTEKLTADHAVLTFSVQDTGIGMTEAQLAGLFQPFTQADTSISRRYGGTGLGLTISQRLVNLMGGKISVQSQLGKGSTFTFTLEFTQQPLATLAKSVTAESLRGLKVLVIDDHAATLDFLKSTLESFSFNVTTTNSAQTGLALLEQQPLDTPYRLVIIDLSTRSSMDSLQAARAIRQSLSLTHTPIILLLSAEEMLHQIETSILDGYLVKPVTRSQLFDMVMQVFGYETTNETSPAQTAFNDAEILKLRGGKILLVEDNEINQIVAAEILQNMGLQVTVANNGEEGIWMLNNGKFDAVLMDIQMPGMDGYQATARIRSDPRFTFNKLPIIAMTAHALDSDRAKALDAGLNDYVSKPIDINRLASTLLRWLTPRKNKKTSRTSQSSNGETDSLPEEITKCLDTGPALARLGDNLSLYRRILTMFREENATKAQTIRRAIQSNDLPQARRLVHTLKGVSGTIGANALMETARALEDAILTEKSDAMQDNLKRLEDQLARVLNATASLEKTVQSGSNSSCDSPIASVAPQLQRLAELLAGNDAEAVDQIEAILRQVQETGCQNEFFVLTQCVRRYDFANALQQLRLLAQKWKLPLTVD